MQEELFNLRALTEHAGWKWLEAVAEGQIETRRPSVFERMENVLEVAGREFDKGEIAGIELFRRLPYEQMQLLEYDIDNLSKELEDAPRREKRRDTYDGDTSGDDGDTFIGDSP